MTNKELEKLFQSKLGSRKVDFDPSSWEGMERMLNSKLPIIPWYVTLATLVKGLTAAIVIGFSGYFIIGQPFEGYTKNGFPAEAIYPDTQTNSNLNSTESSSENSSINTDINNTSNQNNQDNSSATDGGFNTRLSNSPNSYAYADGNGNDKKKKRKNRKDKRKNNVVNPPVGDRFVEKDQLDSKPLPPLKVEYVEPSLIADANADGQKKNQKNRYQKNLAKIGVNFSAISAKNLLPQSEESLNTDLRPAFSLGLVLSQPIGKSWGISTGLNYKWQSANSTATKHDINYSFGEEHIYTTLNYKSLNSIEVPLSTYYRFTSRHQLGIGMYASYLFAARVKYNQERVQAFGSTSESGQSFNNSSIKDVWDYGLTSSYYYNLNSKFQLGLDGWFGISQLQYNPEFNLKSNNFQLRFSLNYWLF